MKICPWVPSSAIVNFVCVTGFVEELFTNMEFARRTVYGGRIAPGALVYSVAEALSLSAQPELNGSAFAFLGLDSLRVVRPTRPGDTLWVEITLADKRLTSGGARGIATFDHRVRNQEGLEVMRYRVKRMISCRPAPPP